MRDFVFMFIQYCLILNKISLTNARVLEIGSKDMNGGMRLHFEEVVQSYWGIDRFDGKGVDQQTDARDYDGQEQFDIVISTDVLEHEEHPEVIIDCAWRALKKGGIFMCTAAGEGYPPHRADALPGEPTDEWYKNITEQDLKPMFATGWEECVIAVYDANTCAIAKK